MTKVFGIIGNPVDKSYSPVYFNEKFKKQGLPFKYKRFALDEIEQVTEIFNTEKNLVGLNVTSPFKEAIIPYLDKYSGAVDALQAVNTIHLVDGKKIGHNTDVVGFEATLQSLYLKHEKCLILGSGGAASAVKFVLNKRKQKFLQVSRTPTTNMISYNAINAEVLHAYPVVINTTPLGMHHLVNQMPPLPYRYLTKQNILIDLIYEPRVTAFLHEGLKRGTRIKNGFQMLIEQAEASWKIWSGIPINS